ncbi:MAG TPA: carbamate kinase, partial [Gaiellaceae bacterium]
MSSFEPIEAPRRRRLVVALGGNALLRRGEPLAADVQRRHAAQAMAEVAALAAGNDVVLTHGNGPQVGLLALQASAYTEVPPYPLDILGAESEGMIGYVLEQELQNRLPGRTAVTVLTQVVVDSADPAFETPTKPIGPVYTEEQARRVERELGWTTA